MPGPRRGSKQGSRLGRAAAEVHELGPGDLLERSDGQWLNLRQSTGLIRVLYRLGIKLSPWWKMAQSSSLLLGFAFMLILFTKGIKMGVLHG